jgi:hypothetical protein
MNTTVQEILLMTNTSFSKRQLCETRTHKSNRHLAPAEQLEVACCNGLLYEMLPEIMPATSPQEKSFLWATELKGSFLRILMGPQPVYVIRASSLDPHIFLSTYRMN